MSTAINNVALVARSLMGHTGMSAIVLEHAKFLEKNNIKVDRCVEKAAFEHREKVFKNLFKVRMFGGAEALLVKLRKKKITLGRKRQEPPAWTLSLTCKTLGICG